MRLVVRVMVVAGVLLLAIWGPWRVSAPGPDDRPVPSPDGEGGPLADGVHGEAVAVGDVQGEPAAPIQEGYVVAIPQDGVGRLWAAAGVEAPRQHELPYLGLDVLPGEVEDAGGSLAAIDAAGFALDLEPGDHLLCLARGHHPVHVAGCAPVTLTGGDRLRLTFGEGGVDVEALD